MYDCWGYGGAVQRTSAARTDATRRGDCFLPLGRRILLHELLTHTFHVLGPSHENVLLPREVYLHVSSPHEAEVRPQLRGHRSDVISDPAWFLVQEELGNDIQQAVTATLGDVRGPDATAIFGSYPSEKRFREVVFHKIIL